MVFLATWTDDQGSIFYLMEREREREREYEREAFEKFSFLIQ